MVAKWELKVLFNDNHDKYEGKQTEFFDFGKIRKKKKIFTGKEECIQWIRDSTGNLISKLDYYIR